MTGVKVTEKGGGEMKEEIYQEWKGKMKRCTKKRGEKKEERDSTGGECGSLDTANPS